MLSLNDTNERKVFREKMKNRFLSFTIIMTMVLGLGGLCACNAQSTETTSETATELTSEESTEIESTEVMQEESFEDDMVIIWQDEILEEYVREQLGKSTGDITYAETKEITALCLNGKSVQTIDDLKYMPALEDLDISSTAVSDVSILARFKNMKRFRSLNKYITDYSVLKEWTELESLEIGSRDLLDLSNMDHLDKLVELRLSGEIKDTDKVVKIVNNNPNLRIFSMADNKLEHFNFVNEFEHKDTFIEMYLTSFIVSGENADIDIQNLIGFTNLRVLGVRSVNITNLSAVKELSLVDKLSFTRCELDEEGIKAISEMESLRILDCSSCVIADKQTLQEMDLEELWIYE